jgi:hypothetical protein
MDAIVDFFSLSEKKAMTMWFVSIALYAVIWNTLHKTYAIATDRAFDDHPLDDLLESALSIFKGACAMLALNVAIGYQSGTALYYVLYKRHLTQVLYERCQGRKESMSRGTYIALDVLVHIVFCSVIAYKWHRHISIVSCVVAFFFSRYWSYKNSKGKTIYHFGNDVYELPEDTDELVWYLAYIMETGTIIYYILSILADSTWSEFCVSAFLSVHVLNFFSFLVYISR